MAGMAERGGEEPTRALQSASDVTEPAWPPPHVSEPAGPPPDVLPPSALRPAGPPHEAPPAPFPGRPSAPPWTRRDAALWLVLAVAGFAVGQIAAALATVVAAGVVGKSQQLSAIARLAVPPEWYVVTSLVGLWVGFFGAPWLASTVRGTKHLVADVGLRFCTVDLAGIAIGVGGQIVVTILYAPFIHNLKHFNAPTQKLTGAAHGWGFVVIAIFTVVGAPFFEELFFRGLLLRGLLQFFAPGKVGRTTARAVAVAGAVAVDGLVFALAHAEWEQFAGLALFGMALAYVSCRTGRLGMNMVAHSSFNLVAILALVSTTGTH